MATLASWNDSAFAAATFTAGVIVEGAVDQTTFAEHPITPAELTFTAPVGNLAPNDVLYAGYAVRLGAGSTNNAAVAVTNTATGAATDYRYTLFTTASAGCSSTAVSTGTIVATSDLGAGTGSFVLDKAALVTNPGNPVYLCFKVTAGSTASQATASTATWKLQAVSS